MTKRKSILLIDDDLDFLESNREMLEAIGYEVHTASSGNRGLELARQIRPRAIILDVMMAYDTEGFDIARTIARSAELSGTKVLLVSGIVSEKKLGAVPHPDADWLPVERVLEKPIDPPKLIREIGRLFTE